MQITINHGGEHHGSCTVARVQQMLNSSELSAIDLVFTGGMSEWKPLGELRAFSSGNSEA